MSVFRNLLMQSTGWLGKPSDWSDIRKDCPANSIALYAGHTPLQQWTLGDRLDNKATFVGYFDSVNPDTNTTTKYAYFVLDHQYRKLYKLASDATANSALSGMTDNIFYYTGTQDPKPIDSQLSGTWVMNKIKDIGVSNYPAFQEANNISVTYNGNTYTAVVPNLYELTQIWNNRETLDTYDPTPSSNLTDWTFWSGAASKGEVLCCNFGSGNSSYTGYTGFCIKKNGTLHSTANLDNSNAKFGFVPIIEIPIDNSNIQYDNLGFTATCVGGYKVFIDGTQYGSTYASGAQCSITWSSLALTTGDDITTPTALKAHKIWISPATEGNNITAFRCDRVASSGTEQQGVLWAHFNLSNEIAISSAFGTNNYQNRQFKAITAKNNKINVKNTQFAFSECRELEYIVVLNGDGISNYNFQQTFYNCYKIKQISLSNITISTAHTAFQNCYLLENIKNSNVIVRPTYSIFSMYSNCYNLKYILPTEYTTAITSLSDYITKDTKLKDTVLDVSADTNLGKIGTYGTSQYFMGGFKGLRVSNEAPFDNATAPQINVNYTGMDRTALVQLFNDLPYNVGYEVVGSPTINNGVASGFSSSDYAKATNINAIPLSDIHSYTTRVSFTTGDSLAVNNQIIGGLNAYFGFRQSTGPQGSLRAVIFDVRNGLFKDLLITTSLQTNTSYIAEQVSNQNECYARFSVDGGTTWTRVDMKGTTSYSTSFQNINIGYGTFGAFTGSIDLNNTYIKINDVYWFRGQPAMTKTLSCVGATGTADLTAEDKDIALTKGWSLTLS